MSRVLSARFEILTLSKLNYNMGRKRSLNDIEKCQILAYYYTGMNGKQISQKIKRKRLATDQSVTVNEITSRLCLNASKRAITNYVNKCGMKCLQANHIPFLTKEHKAKRRPMGKETISKIVWKKVLFTHEKKFNLDGVTETIIIGKNQGKKFMKRRFGGGSLMIWAGESKDFKRFR
ncbi:hypothetical protein RF11_02744 [Thelohanellus kitauei]|uniref:Transposase Tc1-like domain-containing protein n=1 Tax=Thelohanellus kitauei TaxID=669202 RepID=A0A0C2IJ00_THEKT|nr:hypothetical protein RF11_02744 [Thelohanellus kitauei]